MLREQNVLCGGHESSNAEGGREGDRERERERCSGTTHVISGHYAAEVPNMIRLGDWHVFVVAL